MTELTVYDPQEDPDPTRMDGLITRHRSRWFHDTMKALKERGEMEMFKQLEIQFVAAFWGRRLTLPFSQEEFDARFLELIEKDQKGETVVVPVNLLDASGYLVQMDLWLMCVLENIYRHDKDKMKAWIRLEDDADTPEEFVEAIAERYMAEWGEGPTIKPERLRENDVPFDEKDIPLRRAELTCFKELAWKAGNEAKVRLIHKEYDRVGKLPISLDG